MKSFDASTLAMLASGRAVKRDLLQFFLVSGTYGFWTGLGTLTYNGQDYVGAGQLISIQPLAQGMDLSSIPLVLKLNSIPNSNLTPDILASIDAEDYHQKVAIFSTAYIDPDTRTVLSVERWFRGYIDKVEHQDQIGGGAALVCNLESKSRDHLKKGYRTRSDSDQRLINSNDGGFVYCATAGDQTVIWGRASGSVSQQVNNHSGRSGGTGGNAGGNSR